MATTSDTTPATAADREPARDPAPAPTDPGPASTPAPHVIEPESAPAPLPAPSQSSPVAHTAPAAPAVKVPEPLLAEARSIAASHHAEHREPITAAQLKRRLGIGLPMATALHAAL
ncbi:hypothetical protein GCM10010129_48230 [Streptomyces fumigatiscleroticus]|nr:hypothetical protein GCM10010129_48230 [Streptomyces fumigatiscleroticus]